MSLSREQIESLRIELSQPGRRSVSQIARDLGVSKGVVAGHLHRAGIRTTPSWKDIRDRLDSEIQTIRDLAQLGACCWAIARELGVTEATMRSFAERHGIEIRRRPPPSPKLAQQRAEHGGYFSRRSRPLSAREQEEMRRLAEEAIAAGRVTRCPPGYAIGAFRANRLEWAA